MFKYVTVTFPQTTLNPITVYSFTLSQKRYQHEIATIEFKDWGTEFDVIQPGEPITVSITNKVESKTFYGYVHNVSVDRAPGKFFASVTCVGGSFSMKQSRQTVFKDVTADEVIKKIATIHNFVCYAAPYARVYPQISQAGLSDWQLMTRLAKQCGYTLRAQNTELYFQPIMEEYTKYRSEAPVFTMRSMAHPDGSNMYSFKPVISESMTYDEGTKAAVAITGVDVLASVPLTVTQQVRNKKTRTKQQLEFFDTFETSVVALDQTVAKFEAEAAENRNYFPYRAEAEVLGNPNLRPDMAVYLNGVGQPYSGYWIILEAEHHIIEVERNLFVYTTTLKVGADSLGSSGTWTDSQTIAIPASKPQRTVIPNVKQTKVKPVTALSSPKRITNQASKSSFGTIENRAKQASTTARANTPVVWKSKTSSINTIIPVLKKSPIISARLAQKRVGK